MQNSMETAAEAKASIQTLTESMWLFAALNALIAAGAFQNSASYSLQTLAAQINMPITVAEQTINLLAQAGFVTKTNHQIQLATGMQEYIDEIGLDRLRASLCITHGLSASYVNSARQQTLQAGWHYTDELILQSQGLYSQYIVTDCFTQVPAVQNLLQQANTVFLDVGAGVGQIALRACAEYPALKVIALEPADVPFTLATKNINASAYANRIDLRKGMLQDIQDHHTVDVAWFPHVFIDDKHLASCLQKLKLAIKPNGILITTALATTAATQATSIKHLINALYGGLRNADTVMAALQHAGFRAITKHAEVSGYETITAIA